MHVDCKILHCVIATEKSSSYVPKIFYFYYREEGKEIADEVSKLAD